MKKVIALIVCQGLASFTCCEALALEGIVAVPNDPNIAIPAGSLFGPYLVQSRMGGSKNEAQSLRFSKRNDSIEVHRRIDNGTAGSGIVFMVDYVQEDQSTHTLYKFKTQDGEPRRYQDGWLGKFPIPAFTEKDALEALLSGTVGYSLEMNSEFPVNSIVANFRRLANGSINLGAAKVRFKYDVTAYRAGSKIFITTELPAPPVGPDGIVDFKKSIDDFTSRMRGVVEN